LRNHRISENGHSMKVEIVFITTRRPYDDADPGECASVHYIVDDNVVVLTDPEGTPLYKPGRPGHTDAWRRELQPGETPGLVAGRLLREMRGARSTDFYAPIDYPPLSIV